MGASRAARQHIDGGWWRVRKGGVRHLFNARNVMYNAEAMFSLVRVRDLDRDADRRRVDIVVSSNSSTD